MSTALACSAFYLSKASCDSCSPPRRLHPAVTEPGEPVPHLGGPQDVAPAVPWAMLLLGGEAATAGGVIPASERALMGGIRGGVCVPEPLKCHLFLQCQVLSRYSLAAAPPSQVWGCSARRAAALPGRREVSDLSNPSRDTPSAAAHPVPSGVHSFVHGRAAAPLPPGPYPELFWFCL